MKIRKSFLIEILVLNCLIHYFNKDFFFIFKIYFKIKKELYFRID